MSEAHRPPGGNTKYIVAGLFLLAAAGGLVAFLTSSPSKPPTPPATSASKSKVARVNPLAQQDLIIEDEEPDAAAPTPAEPPAVEKPKKRRPKRAKWDCSGDLDRPGLKKVMTAIRPQVRTCYERRLKLNTLLQGDLKLKVKVGAAGKVAATQVRGSLNDNEVFGCVRRLTKSLTFPTPEGGDCAVVDIPFQFSPKH